MIIVHNATLPRTTRLQKVPTPIQVDVFGQIQRTGDNNVVVVVPACLST